LLLHNELEEALNAEPAPPPTIFTLKKPTVTDFQIFYKNLAEVVSHFKEADNGGVSSKLDSDGKMAKMYAADKEKISEKFKETYEKVVKTIRAPKGLNHYVVKKNTSNSKALAMAQTVTDQLFFLQAVVDANDVKFPVKKENTDDKHGNESTYNKEVQIKRAFITHSYRETLREKKSSSLQKRLLPNGSLLQRTFAPKWVDYEDKEYMAKKEAADSIKKVEKGDQISKVTILLEQAESHMNTIQKAISERNTAIISREKEPKILSKDKEVKNAYNALEGRESLISKINGIVVSQEELKNRYEILTAFITQDAVFLLGLKVNKSQYSYNPNIMLGLKKKGEESNEQTFSQTEFEQAEKHDKYKDQWLRSHKAAVNNLKKLGKPEYILKTVKQAEQECQKKASRSD